MYSAPALLTLATLLPLASAMILLLWGARLKRLAGYIAAGSIILALGLSLATLIFWVGRPQFNERGYAETVTILWLPVHNPPQIRPPEDLLPIDVTLSHPRPGGLQIGVLVDALTIAMFLAVATIGALVHVFSIAAMAGQPRYHRFLAHLNLLCFAMFALALSDNLIQTLAMLQLLAVCTWLLTGFARERRAPIRAAAKGLMIQTIGMAAFMVGAGTLVAQTPIGLSGLTYFAGGADLASTPVLQQALGFCSEAPLLLGLSWLTWTGICIFTGAMAMSAQFPIHVWLADAAEAPSPALAMTGSIASIAAGAFVVARLYGIFTLDARLFIATIGCLSVAGGALLALVQTNIKRILTGSSVSQLGLVMLFFGAGAYVAALYVLFVHAFCNACLFLAAGSVLHSCGGEPQLRRMGGLFRKLPITGSAFLLAMLALCGTPWLSGFFGMEMGLAVVHRYAEALPSAYGTLLWWIPEVAMVLTAFYMWRCWWLIFGGRARDPELHNGAHENPLMTLVLILLAGLTVLAPYLDIDSIVAASVLPMVAVSPVSHPDPLAAISKPMGWSPLFAALCIMLFYMQGFALVDRFRRLPGVNLVHLWLREDFFLDHLYEGVIVPAIRLVAALCRLVDAYIIDNTGYLVARGIRILGAAANQVDVYLLDMPAHGIVRAALFSWRAVRRSRAPSAPERA